MTLPERLDPSAVAFFLDFDGTLCEIVERPEAVEVLPRTRQALEILVAATGGALAVISGRALSDLDRHLVPLELPAAGSHGAEIRLTPGGEIEQTAAGARLDDAAREVAAFAERHDLLFERKPGALTLHYRSDPSRADEATALIDRLAGEAEEFRAMHGNMVAELGLRGVDKGAAVERFLGHPPFAGRRPLMAGDDTTDEDGFRVVQRHGGLAIKVGEGPSDARCRMDNTAAFVDWLARTAEAMQAGSKEGSRWAV